MKAHWILTMVGCIAGGFKITGALYDDSAPRQGAAAAIAVGFAVIPYCLARALEGLSQSRETKELTALNEKVAVHTKLLRALSNSLSRHFGFRRHPPLSPLILDDPYELAQSHETYEGLQQEMR